MKRISITLALTLAMLLVFVGAAYANFGPHGGYVDDTDSCAGCHRAHTSFSPVQWQDQTGNDHNALLVGSATTMTEFCNACHGNNAPGASTNVVSGVFDSGPSADAATTVPGASQTNGSDGGSVVTAYQTESTFDAPLNGGGFSLMPDPYVWETSATVSYKAISSAHSMEQDGPLWGAGNAVADYTNLDCADCHDPHGTSNFRLLKGEVNGNTVGGYEADGETPNAFVVSNETGYPVGGWLKHEAGAGQMATYQPDYTGGTPILHQDPLGNESMSTWCSGCHENYNVRDGAAGNSAATYDYGTYEGGGAVDGKVRHRHPVDITLAAGNGPGRALQENVVDAGNWLPLEEEASGSTAFYQNYIGCLTCHRAHGSSAEMTGWAKAHLADNGTGTWIPVRDAIPGVDPDKVGAAGIAGGAVPVGSSALLRADNRGVCERCHNK